MTSLLKPSIYCSFTLLSLIANSTIADKSTTTSNSISDSITTSQAVAMHGDIKYPEGFKHFDYADPEAVKGGTVKLAAIGSYDSLNPFIAKGQSGEGIGMIYDTLTRKSMDEPFTEYGLIASQIELPKDRSWVIFHINKSARFHDGKPITAEDVSFTFDLLMTKGHPQYRAYYADVEKAEALDKHRVKFSFKNKQNPELALIIGELAVLPKHYWQDKDFSKASLHIPLGSGPYKIAKAEPGRSLIYKRVTDYWAKDLAVNVGLFNYDTLQYDYYRDSDVSVEAIKAGEYDYRYENSSKNWATSYQDVHKLLKKWEPSDASPTGMQGFIFNTRNPLFKDIKVRRALNYAFDFEWTNKNIFYSAYTRTNSYFSNSELASTALPQGRELAILEPFRDRLPSSVFNEVYQAPRTDGTGRPRQNLRLAKQLLEEAGWKVENNQLVHSESKKKFSFEILLVSPAFERIVNPFVKNLERLGIKASVRLVDTSQYINRLRKFDFDMNVNVFGQSLSPGNEQRSYWHSKSADIDASRNIIGIKNPVIDELIEMIITAPNRAELVHRTRALDRVLLHHHYVIPHFHNRTHRIAYWDKFARPAIHPKYDPVFNTGFFTWWIDSKKEATLAKHRNGQE